MRLVGQTDLNGHGDCMHVNVKDGFAYVGHGFSNGITTIDVRDAKNPRVVDFIACPPGTRAFHIQTHDDLLLAVNAPSVWNMQEFQNEKAYFGGSPADKLKDQTRFTAGIRVYDISRPEKPVEIGFNVRYLLDALYDLLFDLRDLALRPGNRRVATRNLDVENLPGRALESRTPLHGG